MRLRHRLRRLFSRLRIALGIPRGLVEVDPADTGPAWCVVANVRESVPWGPGGAMRRGHRLLSPGTKVYLLPPGWRIGSGKYQVTALRRGSRKRIRLVMDRRYLTNWRAKLEYSPSILAHVRANERGAGWSEDFARKVVAMELEEERVREAGRPSRDGTNDQVRSSRATTS